MRKRRLYIFLALATMVVLGFVIGCQRDAVTPAGYSTAWHADTSVCCGFEMRYVRQPDDYSGAVRSTVIRKLASDRARRAVLYVHGYNDYFLQSELADTIVGAGYDFYAVDLRKYGRSIMPGQVPYQARSLDEYFADIDSALAVMDSDGITEVALMGHSTGGLITSYYMAKHAESAGLPPIRALILNSPFLDWNIGGMEKLIPAVSTIGAVFPNLKIPQGSGLSPYAQSLLKQYHGEWSFNTEWKTTHPQPVEASWIRAITRAQKYLQEHPDAIQVPVLLMYSAQSVYGDEWTPEHQQGDAVLDVDEIRTLGAHLSAHEEQIEVPDGLHDLFLSAPSVRIPLYHQLIAFLNTNLPMR